MLFQWGEKFFLKISSIDEQHKKLVELINQLHDAMSSGSAKDVMGKIIDELSSYTKTHFTYEEKLLTQTGYPALAKQKQEHEEFVKKVQGYQADHKAGKLSISLNTMMFLKEWLSNHILVLDKAYVAHLQSKGIK